MSDTRKSLDDAKALQNTAAGGDRRSALSIAVIAVLAAVATLFAHHSSIAALAQKNEAVLTQARASDAFAKYEAKQVRFEFGRAMIAAGLPRSPQGRTSLQSLVDREGAGSVAMLARAQALEAASEQYDRRAGTTLRSYETLQTGTTLFEVAIVLVSIAALASARSFLSLGYGFAAAGAVLLAVGLLQAAR